MRNALETNQNFKTACMWIKEFSLKGKSDIFFFFFCTCLNKSHFQVISASSITYYMLQAALKWDSGNIQPPGNSQLVKLLHPSPHIFNYIVLIQSPLICLWFINAACLNYHHKQRICVSECFIINKIFMHKNSLHSHPRTLLNVNV